MIVTMKANVKLDVTREGLGFVSDQRAAETSSIISRGKSRLVSRIVKLCSQQARRN